MNIVHDFVRWDGVADAAGLSSEGVEVWTDVVGGGSQHLISNMGRFGRLTGGSLVLLRGSQSSTGYVLYTMLVGGHRKSVVAHRMVLNAFVGPPPTAEHTDGGHLGVGDKTDNRLCNLAWQTRSENMKAVAVARREGRPSSTTDASPVPNRTYSFTEDQVKEALHLFSTGSVTIASLARLLNASDDVVRRFLVGETWDHLPRNKQAIESRLGRSGEVHHKASVQDKALADALQLYVDHHWSSAIFAKHLNIPLVTAHSILSGRTRSGVPRPPGFEYPWPDASSMNAKSGEDHPATSLTRDRILSVFEKIEAGEFQSVRQVSEVLGLSKGATYSLLRGGSWSDIPRSRGFQEALARMQRTLLTPEEQEAVIEALLAGMPREDVVKQFNLSPTKLQAYITRANKRRYIKT